MTTSPFRVLVIDDEFPLSSQIGGDAWSNFVKTLRDRAPAGQELEIWVLKAVTRDEQEKLTFHRIVPNSKKQLEKGSTFLPTCHAIVLDLGGIGVVGDPLQSSEVEKAWLAFEKGSPGPLDASTLTMADVALPGVTFFFRYFESLRYTWAVFVLTQLETKTQFEAGMQLINPLCTDHQSIKPCPWLLKFSKGGEQEARMTELICELHEDHAKNFAQLNNRGQIEFAGSTNEPVLIVGESGTGKEYIARALHRVWSREKRIQCGSEPPPPFVVVNCGGLSEEAAQSWLFGHVRGSSVTTQGHRPGAILQACGCQTMGIRAVDEDKYLKGALLRAQEAVESLEKLVALSTETSTDNSIPAWNETKRLLFRLRGLLYAGATQNQIENGKESDNHLLSEVIKEVEWKFRRLIQGAEDSEHFKKRLLELLDSKVLEQDSDSQNPFDLRFKKNVGFVGTLFLDEFADLPPMAQALLLRFLEDQTRELQPLGYPGRIAGVKVRVIAATNDDAVARLAGVSDLPERPGGSGRDLALRHDLVQRIRHHVIRAEPVTEHNAERTLRVMCGMKWEPNGVTAVIDYVRKHQKSPNFGHRRELRRIVTLAEEHVSKGAERGLREFEPGRVTLEIVSRFLKPSLGPVTADARMKEGLPPVMPVMEPEYSQSARGEAAETLNKLKELLTEHGDNLVIGVTLAGKLIEVVRSHEGKEAIILQIGAVLNDLASTRGTANEYKHDAYRVLFGLSKNENPADHKRNTVMRKLRACAKVAPRKSKPHAGSKPGKSGKK